MATAPAFAVTPRLGSVSVATADSSYTAPTNVGTVLTGVAAGTRISEVVAKIAITSTSTAAIVRVFLFDSSGSGTYYLFDELVLASSVASASVASTRVSAVYNNLILPSASWSLRVTTSVSQATHVTALGADL